MSNSSIFSESAMTVLIGVSVVFGVLLLLTFTFWLFGKVVGRGQKTPITVTPVVEPGVPDEVVAVIAAALAAMSEDDGKHYTVRRIRPVRVGKRKAWASAGIADNTRPF